MKKLNIILKKLEKGEIDVKTAKLQIFDLFEISKIVEHGHPICECPECGEKIVYGFTKETMLIVKNSKLLKRNG